jgi:iron complex outermembrane recepter protein
MTFPCSFNPKPLRLFIATLACGGVLFAQSTDLAEDEPVIELSPFTVDSSQDQGYVATNTLAGSRLNSALRDTAAPISVFTSELIQDMGANDVQSATFYAVSAEEFTEAEIGDQAGNQLQNDGLQFNIRGFKTSATRNYFEWGLNSDNYNVERIDFSRGPNSILYGLGSPGGVVNTSTKQAIMLNAYGVELQAGSWGAYRAAVDINQELVEDKWAIRLNALTADEDSWRRSGYKDQERLHLATTFQPFSSTRIRAEFETADINQNKPRPWGPLEGFRGWEAAGSPVIDTARGPIPPGASSLGSRTRLTFSNTGQPVTDWSLMGATNSAGFNYAIFDFDLVPREFDAIGFGSRVDSTYDTTSVFVEQRILEDLFLELSFNSQDSTGEENRPINWNSPLRIDLNRQLPNGSANPNFGSFYVEDNFRGFRRDESREILRATASYELKLADQIEGLMGRILGRHQIAGLVEQREDKFTRAVLRELNSTPIENSDNLRDPSNRIYRRTYVDFDTGLGIDGAVNPLVLPSASEPVTTRLGDTGSVTPAILTENIDGNISELDTTMVAVQSYWWDGKLVTTYGRRNDERRTRGRSLTRERNIVVDIAFDQPWGPREDATTETKGVVFHATPWMSLLYNDSESINLGSTNRFMIDGSLIGDERGVGEDFGVRFGLLDGQLSFTASAYETASVNRLTFNAEGPLKGAANDIWEVVDPSQFVSEALPSASNEDLVSEGYEFELVANPTPQWSIIANFSMSDVKVSNLSSRNVAYINANRSLWQQSGSTAIDGSTDYSTVNEAIAFMDNQILTRITAFDNREKLGHADRKGALFTNYRFAPDSALAGFSIGGGMRYFSAPVIGFSAADAQGRAETFRGDSSFMMDARAGYRREIMDGRASWSLQLNVFNVLGNDDIVLTLADTSGTPQRYRFQEPRNWSITSRFEF